MSDDRGTGRVMGHALELAAGRVQDAERLIDATGRLRTTMDRYDWFIRDWYSHRSTQVNVSSLKLKLTGEFEAVSSAARKLGGKRVLLCAVRLDQLRGSVLWLIDPPVDAGIPDNDAHELMNTLDALRGAATVAIGRKRRTQWLLVGSFVVGLAAGVVLGLLLR